MKPTDSAMSVLYGLVPPRGCSTGLVSRWFPMVPAQPRGKRLCASPESRGRELRGRSAGDLTSVQRGGAVDVTCHEGGLCLLPHGVIPHPPDPALGTQPKHEGLSRATLPSRIFLRLWQSTPASWPQRDLVDTPSLPGYLGPCVVSGVASHGRGLKGAVSAPRRGADAAVGVTQALAVLLVHLCERGQSARTVTPRPAAETNLSASWLAGH